MNCRHCGAAIDGQKKFCPECGGRLTEQHPQEIHAHPRSHFWVKVLLGVLSLTVVAILATALLSEDSTDIISDQLADIREGKIEDAYYKYTARAFQSTTSLDHFREFMKVYPDFTKSKSIRFVDRNVVDDGGILLAKLMTADGVEEPVQYTVIREGDAWKILNIKFEGHAPEGQAEPFDKKPLQKVVQAQLDLLRQHKLQEAYNVYTSKGFKKSTPYDGFEEFLRDEPVLVDNKSVDLDELSFDNNIATLTGTLVASNGSLIPVEYDLVDEDGDWKILHIEVQMPSQSDKDGAVDAFPLKVTKYVLGNQIDNSGMVKDPKTILKTNSGDIYLNLYLAHAKAGTRVAVIFEHLDTLSKIPPVVTRLTEDGDSTATFIFSPPKDGWPAGDYRVRVEATTGMIDSYDFKVEGK